MILTNNQIYSYANNLTTNFVANELKLPIKINFYLIKNKNLLVQLAQELDKNRTDILSNYGVLSDDKTSYIIPSEKVEAANQALNELFNLTQEVQIYMISLKDFNETDILTLQQMEALMFMIEEE